MDRAELLHPRFKNKNLGPRIQELHVQGKTRQEIAKALNCALSSAHYHTRPEYRERGRVYARAYKGKHIKTVIKDKVNHFATAHVRRSKEIKAPNKRIQKAKELFHVKVRSFNNRGDKLMRALIADEVLDKFGTETICYLTGEKIDLLKPKTYEFDHIIPVSRGGDNTINNLGICTKEANRAKDVLTPDEFFKLCEKILVHRGYQVTPPVDIIPDKAA